MAEVATAGLCTCQVNRRPVQQWQPAGSLVQEHKGGLLCSHCRPPRHPSTSLPLHYILAPLGTFWSHFSSMEVLGGRDCEVGHIPGPRPRYGAEAFLCLCREEARKPSLPTPHPCVPPSECALTSGSRKKFSSGAGSVSHRQRVPAPQECRGNHPGAGQTSPSIRPSVHLQQTLPVGGAPPPPPHCLPVLTLRPIRASRVVVGLPGSEPSRVLAGHTHSSQAALQGRTHQGHRRSPASPHLSEGAEGLAEQPAQWLAAMELWGGPCCWRCALPTPGAAETRAEACLAGSLIPPHRPTGQALSSLSP